MYRILKIVAHLISHQKVFLICFLMLLMTEKCLFCSLLTTTGVFLFNREAGCPVLMLQWVFFSLKSSLWFNLLRFCCWTKTIQSPPDNQCRWAGKRDVVLNRGCGRRPAAAGYGWGRSMSVANQNVYALREHPAPERTQIQSGVGCPLKGLVVGWTKTLI